MCLVGSSWCIIFAFIVCKQLHLHMSHGAHLFHAEVGFYELLNLEWRTPCKTKQLTPVCTSSVSRDHIQAIFFYFYGFQSYWVSYLLRNLIHCGLVGSQIRSSYARFHVTACHLFSTKPLPEPMMTYCQLDPQGHTSVKWHYLENAFEMWFAFLSMSQCVECIMHVLCKQFHVLLLITPRWFNHYV